MKRSIIVTAGGTGGHVFPGLAVAKQLQAQGIEVAWIGTQKGIEASVIPPSQIRFYSIDIKGLRGKHWRARLTLPWQLIKALWQTRQIFKSCRPALILAMGGYVTGPVGLLAWFYRIPLIVHEQNACFGLTNRVLSKLANKTLIAFPIKEPHCTHVGNPIRAELVHLSSRIDKAQKSSDTKLNLLVLGGSQGALAINTCVPEALSLLPLDKRPNVWHQTGQAHFELTQQHYDSFKYQAQLAPFIEDMAKAYEWADVIISRAGALTIAEITALGRPSILIPYPHAVDDHQTANAKALVKAGGALLIQESDLTPSLLVKHLERLYVSSYRQGMGKTAKQFGIPGATEHVAAHCLEIYYEK